MALFAVISAEVAVRVALESGLVHQPPVGAGAVRAGLEVEDHGSAGDEGAVAARALVVLVYVNL